MIFEAVLVSSSIVVGFLILGSRISAATEELRLTRIAIQRSPKR
jgi:hypothetical protein